MPFIWLHECDYNADRKRRYAKCDPILVNIAVIALVEMNYPGTGVLLTGQYAPRYEHETVHRHDVLWAIETEDEIARLIQEANAVEGGVAGYDWRSLKRVRENEAQATREESQV